MHSSLIDNLTRHLSRHAARLESVTNIDFSRFSAEALSSGAAEAAGQLRALAQSLEEHVLLFRNPEAGPHAQHLHFSASDDGAWEAISPLLRLATQSPDVSDVGVTLSERAWMRFNASDLRSHFAEVGEGNEPLVVRKAMALHPPYASRPCDAYIATVATYYGPEAFGVANAKSILGASKVYLLAECWGHPGATIDKRNFESGLIDGIICNDQLAADILGRYLPSYPRHQIHPLGTPQLDAMQIAREKELIASGRYTLGLDGSEVTAIFLGGIHGAEAKRIGLREDIQERTAQMTAEAMAAVASRNQGREHVLLFRPHPRDPGSKELMAAANVPMPANMRIVNADQRICTINEACYCSHLVTSLASTESFKAPLRGRMGALLGYESEPGLGADYLSGIYDEESQEQLSSHPGLRVIRSSQEAEKLIGDISPEKGLWTSPSTRLPLQSAAWRVLEFMLSGSAIC